VLSKEPFNAVERRAVTGLACLYCLRMLGLFMVLPLFAVYAHELEGASTAQHRSGLGGLRVDSSFTAGSPWMAF